MIELGLDGALYRLHELVRGAIDAMPPCRNGAELRSLMLSEAKRLVLENKPDAALLDYMLPDGNGVELGAEFLQTKPDMLVIVMTGTILPPEEEALCEENNFPVLRKPFLASDVMAQIRSRLNASANA